MTLYSDAVSAVRAAAEARQAALDAAAAAARRELVDAVRAAAVDGIGAADPARPLGELLAQTVSVGRDDGYPKLSAPRDTARVLAAAAAAGLLPPATDRWGRVVVGALEVYAPGDDATSGVECRSGSAAQDARSRAVDAWTAAADYRKRQTWQQL